MNPRFSAAVQRSRLAIYGLATLTAVGARMAGAIDTDYAEGLPLLGLACASAFVLERLYARGVPDRLASTLEPAWMGMDIVLITWGVHITGGATSPWFLWYLANTSAAAFLRGRAAAVAVAAANSAAYVGVLYWRGDIDDSHALVLAVYRKVFLYAAAFFFIRGILALKEKQEQVARLRAEQDAKVEQLLALTQDLDQGTRALADANVQIREADRMKSQFLANMSHELRTPLNSIIGFSEILIDRLAGQLSDKHLKFLRNIHGSGQHLLGIINDILDLSKIEAGQMEFRPEPVRVAGAVEGVLHVMHGMASKGRVSFELDVADDVPVVETDAVKLKQVLYNLLSNAVKFSPEGSQVRIRVRTVLPDASPLGTASVAISVQDTGPGIAPEHHELIFQEFRQIDGSATRAFGGTGLGLALVRQFLEAQGGRVTLASQPGRGSTFTVHYPVGARLHAASPAALSEDAAGGRVLVVEDDPVAFDSISRCLADAGYSPVRAHSGEEALELIRRVQPTAVTLDLALPGLSGWEVLKSLKADAETRQTPVIIISLMDNRELGLALGADDYFVKPLDPTALLARLRELAPRAGEATRLLLIDDDPAVHELLEEELSGMGFVIEHANDGSGGLECALAAPPDVIVLDLLMPGLSGFEVAARLAAHEVTHDVPVVVLTAHDLGDDERAALAGRVADLVPKGQGAAAELVRAVRRLQGRRPHEAGHAR